MNNKIVIGVVAIFLVAMILPFGFASTNEGDVSIGETYKVEFSDRTVVVYGSDDFSKSLQTDLSEQTSKVTSSKNINEEITSDMILFEESWIYKNNAESVDMKIYETVKSGVPVLFIGKNSYLFEDSKIELTSYGYTGTEIGYGVFEDEFGSSHFYSVEGDDLNEAANLLYSWANEMTSGKDPYKVESTFSWMTSFSADNSRKEFEHEPIPSKASNSGAYWGYIGSKTSSTTCGNYGYLSQTTWSYKLFDFVDPEGYTYYAFHYFQSGEPNSNKGYRVADLYLLGDFPINTINLIGFSPGTTQGTNGTTLSVSLGGGISGAGPSGSFGLSGSWSYSIADIILTNTSKIGNQTVNFYHDVAEDKGVGSGAIVEPSITVKTEGSYIHCDDHRIKMCKEVKSIYWILNHAIHTTSYVQFQTFTMCYTTQISNDVVTGNQIFTPF